MRGKGKGKNSQRSRSERAGVVFPVGRLTRHLRQRVPHARLGSGAPVYLAAVLEYLTAEMIELAGNISREQKVKRIQPKQIRSAIKLDEELMKLCGEATISNGGSVTKYENEINEYYKKSKKPSKHRKSSSSVKPKMKAKKAKKQVILKTAKKLPKIPKRITTTVTGGIPGGASRSIDDVDTADIEVQELPILSEATLFLGQKLSVLKGDVVHVNAQAIVHSTNSSFSTSGQVGQALVRAGGDDYAKEVRKLSEGSQLGSCAGILGVVFSLTVESCDMFNIHAKKIIHCNIPSWKNSSNPADIETCVKNCLKRADNDNLKSIAFPSIGSGNAGWPKQIAAETILKTINSYFQSVMASSIRQVFFVLYDLESVDIYVNELRRQFGHSTVGV